MTKPQIKIVDVTSGEEIVRDATSEEVAQMATDKARAEERQIEIQAKATAKAALLSKLGITAEEARLLLS